MHSWITAVLLLLISTNLYAQGNEDVLAPCQSHWKKYSNIKEKTSIVRSDQNYRIIHTQHQDYYTGLVTHTFSILRYSSNIENYFSTTFDATIITPYSVDITDMEIFEDICYFCGTLTRDTVEPSYIIHHQDGIVGRFSPSAMHAGTGSLEVCTVPQTKQLSRLAISGPSQAIAQINAIGIMKGNNTSCMVELRQNASNSWTGILDYLPNTPKIYFSDILSTYNSIILLSQLKCANDHFYGEDDYDLNHQKFLLDRFSLAGCHYDCSPSYVTSYMAHYELNNYEDYVFHYDEAPMALCQLEYGLFAVAFGVNKNGSYTGGIRFFPFQNIWQYDSSIYYNTGKYAKVTEMTNRNLTFETHILSTDNNNSKGIIANPWPIAPSNMIKVITSPGPVMNSLTNKANTSILEITGHDNPSNLNILEQDADSLHLSSCLTIATKSPIIFPEKRGDQLIVEWHFINLNIEWKQPEIVDSGKTEAEIICKKCNQDE